MSTNINFHKSLNFMFLWYFPYLLFFFILFIFFYFFTDYIFFFQEKSVFFMTGTDFLMEHLLFPGKFLLYLGNFFSACYYYPLIGSLIISLFIISSVFIISQILYILTWEKANIIPFIAGGFLFYLHTHYHYSIFNTIGIFLQLLLFFLIIRCKIKHSEWFGILIIPVWFYLTGSFAWIFLVMFSFYIFRNPINNKWFKVLTLWGILFLFLYLSKEYFFFQPFSKLLIFPFTSLDTGSQAILFFLLIISISALPLIRLSPDVKNKRIIKYLTKTPVASIVIIFIALVPGVKRIDKSLTHYFHTEKLFYENKMDDLIYYNKANPSNNRLTSYLVNIALCETGKLNDMLFHFPQSIENNTLFMKWERVGEILKRGGYFYYTVGIINEAHRWFFEYMVMEGHTPQGLKMLIKTELINGNYAMAAKYINMLKKSPFYFNEASEFEKLLFDDAAVDRHPELGEKKRNKIAKDFIIDINDPFLNLEISLVDDFLNKQAFEYILAYLLLKKDFMAVVNEVPELKKFGFKSIPVHIQEALSVYQALPESGLTDAGKYTISKEIILNFQQFYKTFEQFGNNRNAAKNVLQKKFGNTFWYYVLYD